MGKATPLMNQYQAIKKRYPDCLLFFRLGDFYELFGDDAIKASRELEIVLTSRGLNKDNKVPMCGFPYHAVEGYLKRLLENGHKIAICEQLEEAKPGKGLVKRDVVRVITPGTVLNPAYLEQGQNNFILSLYQRKESAGCAWSDISTGKFQVTQFSGLDATECLLDLLSRLQPVECIFPADQSSSFDPLLNRCWESKNLHLTKLKNKFSRRDAWKLIEKQFGPENLVGIDRDAFEEGLMAAANLLSYIIATQKVDTLPFKGISIYTPGSSMYLDAMTRRNMELFTTLREGKKEGTLLWALDRTLTGMGARLLRSWLGSPLLDLEEIKARQEAAAELTDKFFLRNELQEYLKKVYDLERIVSRVDWQLASPRDLLGMAKTLDVIPQLKAALGQANSKDLQEIGELLDPVTDVKELLFSALDEEPPANLKNGGIIKDGYHPEVDKLREMIEQGENWLRRLEEDERARTGIKSLKIDCNKVFGYYIEVTKPNLHLIPDNYIRKQTLKQAERFITPELKEQEALFLGATERLKELEYQVFLEIRQQVGEVSEKIRQDAGLIARVDCLVSFAETAARYHYVKPEINRSGIIKIRNGYHPVLQQLLPEGAFVPNDLEIGEEDNRIHLLTGPNMAGKSTYMRQMALLILMAQCGSLVPAEEAEIGIVDRLFVRAGALDDLGKGQSTFMMEMNEVSYIVHHATKDSFIVLDEIGRGTGTFDGLGIAWAIIEYIHDVIGARTIFATHYHQLTQLSDKLPGVVNYSVAVAEEGEEIIFLRKVVPGGTDKSYGIQVARLANLPEELINRANQVAASLEAENSAGKIEQQEEKKAQKATKQKITPVQLVLFDDKSTIVQELQRLNLIQITPLEALNILYDWQQRFVQTKKKTEHSRKKEQQETK